MLMTTKYKNVISPEKMNSSNKNILIVLDATGCTPVSMRTATELAARLQAGIKALYIEDINLLNAVDLPFTREVSLHTAAISSIDLASMRQRFQADAETIKKQIEEIAMSHSVSLTFSSMRGHKTQVIRERTEEVNMVLIPAVYSSTGREWQHLLKHVVVVVYDEQNPSSDSALNLALSQAAKKNYQLFIIADSEHAKQHVEQMLSQYSGYALCQLADFSNLDEVTLLLYKHEPALFVLPEDSRLIKDEQMLQQLINSLESDILLVR